MTTTTDVQALYTNILRRDGTDSEVSSFVSVIDSGSITLAQARQSLIDSTEANTFVDAVVRLYQSAFGRQPDAAGFTVQVQALKAAVDGGTDFATASSNLAAAFAASTEFTNRFGTSTTVDQAYLTSLYLNVLGRTPSGAEVDAWIATGDTRAEVLRGFSDSPEYVASSDSDVNQLLENTATGTALDTTKSLSATPGGSTDTASGGTTGTTFTLQTSADNITGTDNDDTINGVVDSTASLVTLSAADIIRGGSGTDTLNITLAGNPTATINGADIAGIEIINVRNTGSGAAALDASQVAGVTNVGADRGTGSFSVTNLATSAVMTVFGNGTVVGGEVAFSYATATDAVTLIIDGGTKLTADINNDSAGVGNNTSTGTNTTATISSTGQANTVGTVDLANNTLTTVTINAAVNLTGDLLSEATDQVDTDGAVTISGAATLVKFTQALDNTIKTLDASGLTAGGITATLGTLNSQTVTGGAGDDTITTGGELTTGSVNAGAGADTLVVGTNVSHVNSATKGGKFTNFETLSVGDSLDVSVISGITAVSLDAMTSKTISGLTATQAAAITIAGAQTTALTLTLASSSGSSDVVTVNLTSSTATTNIDVAGLGVSGVETVNINVTTGTNTTGDTAFSFGANLSDNVSKVNITGTQDVTLDVAANTLDVVAVAIDASAVTGTGDLTITGGVLLTGSTVTGTLNADTILVSTTTGTTYDGGAGNDVFSANFADLVATGSNDNKVGGGDGTDTLTILDVTTTLIDNHFSFVTGMEKLALTNTTGDASITTGGFFETAFSTGAVITTGLMAAAKDVTLVSGTSARDITLTIDATLLVGTAAENHVLDTGSGADTITFTGDDTFVGISVGAQGTIVINTRAGDDTISVTVGTLLNSTGGQFLVITAGTGADSITKVGVNSTTVTSVAHYVIASGDSLATAGNFDTITGFDLSNGTNLSDGLDLAGTAAIGTLGTSIDFGTILSHSITNGVATFDDAASFAATLVINATNLADVVGYLAANTSTNDTVAFTYDSNASGTVDATLVYQNAATDILVQLSATTAVDALVTTNAANANDLFIF